MRLKVPHGTVVIYQADGPFAFEMLALLGRWKLPSSLYLEQSLSAQHPQQEGRPYQGVVPNM